MEKKNIAFILKKMEQGGPTTVFFNILRLLNPNQFHITLFLLNSGGTLFNEIPSSVQIEYIKPRGLFCTKTEDSYLYSLWMPLNFFIRIISKLARVIHLSRTDVSWKIKERIIKRDKRTYYFGMSLIEGIPNYYLSRFINSKLKIGRIPTDYKAAKLNKEFDNEYFNNLDYIVTNSVFNLKILKEVFPSISDRFILLETIVLPDLIREKAKSYKGFSDDYAGTRILTLSRLDDTKGTDIAINACELLIKKGLKIRWYIIGDGPKEKYLVDIESKQIREHLVLLNPIVNPLPFLNECDIYVQPSRYEGNSNSIQEAKSLSKPIVITNFNSSSEHITHMKDGLITEINEESLANAISFLIENDAIRNCFISNLKQNFLGNHEEFNKILELANSNNMLS